MGQAKRVPLIDKHRACPHCGYDLYNLPCENKVVRCPECGEDVELGRARMELLARQVNQAHLLIVIGLAAGVLATAAGLLANAYPDPWTLGPGIALSSVWLVCTVIYVRRYWRIPGALRVLSMFHASVVAALFGMYTIWLDISDLRSDTLTLYPLGFGGAAAGGLLIIGGLLVVSGWMLARRAYDLLIGVLDQQLQ